MVEALTDCLHSMLSVCLWCLSTDQGSAYSGDLESEAVSTPHSWGGEDESTSNPQRGAEGPVEPPSTTASPSMLDLEADYPPGKKGSENNNIATFMFQSFFY